MPFINPIVLSFGVIGNYMFHLTELLKGNEKFTLFKLGLPTICASIIYQWGLWGLVLLYI
jgi:preprotein translocase subunit SecY